VSGFFPADLSGWMAVLAQIGAAAAVAWRAAVYVLRQEIREKLAATEKNVVTQINGVGGRVRRVEMGLESVQTLAGKTEEELRGLRDKLEADMRKVVVALGRLDERSRQPFRPPAGGDVWGGKDPP
jgi:negative regulator of sigma E activity